MLLHDEIINYLNLTWREICDEFEQEVPIVVCSQLDYVMYMLNNISENEANILEETTQFSNNMTAVGKWAQIINNHIGDFSALANAHAFISGEPRKPVEFNNTTVFVNSEYLHLEIFHNMDRIPELKKFIRVVLKHEMGHILDNLEAVKRKLTLRQYLKEFKSCSILKRKFNRHLKHYTEEETLFYYFSIPDEAKANTLVNLSLDELIEVHSAVTWF